MHQLLIKYLENRCSAQELDEVLAYIKTPQGQRHLTKLMDQDMHKGFTNSSTLNENELDEQLFTQIKSRIDKEGSEAMAKHTPIYKRWYAIAATVTVMLLTAWLLFFFLQPPSYTLYQTAFGETKIISLPDGSSVTLNANSSLRLPSSFMEKRQVWLNGEAFFEVEEVTRKQQAGLIKFTVHTERLDVEVLGTAFNVQDWQQKTQVVLSHGSVRLKAANQQELTMKPGELVEISDGESAIKKMDVNPELYTSWKENKLLCDDTPLAEIADLIRHRYGKEITFQQESLQDIPVTGTLPLQDLTLLSQVLQESLTINIKVYETEIVISKSEKPAQ